MMRPAWMTQLLCLTPSLVSACSNLPGPPWVDEGNATSVETTSSETPSTETYDDEESDDGAFDLGEPDLPVGCPPKCDGTKIPDLDAVHVIADPSRGLLYVTVKGDAPEYANELVVVDPGMAMVVDSVFVGSSPGTMALSDDASTLWVGIDGSNEIARVDVQTSPPTVVASHYLPPTDDGLVRASDMIVLPGTVDSVAVVLDSIDYGFSGLALLDDGVPRPDQFSPPFGPSRLTSGPPGWLFGFNDEGSSFGLYPIEVLDTGLTATEHQDLVSGFTTNIVYAALDDRIYASSGEVVDVSDPSQPLPAGEFAWEGRVILQLEQQRILMLSGPDFNRTAWTLRSLDPMTFTQTDSAELVFDAHVTESLEDFTTADGEVLAVIFRGLFSTDPSQLFIFDNPL